MCGISGFVNMSIQSDDFTKITAHRGPDDTGMYQHKNLVLGHNRLSIQDLTANGHQPFISRDQRFVLVFNGEIYNHWEIRIELLQLGYEFFSHSDTETLLNGFRQFHSGILHRLKGIYSFAVFDRDKNELFMARDQFGVKPFYYYHNAEIFAFASELKAFWQFQAVEKEIEPINFAAYLNYLWSPGESTPFQQVKKLLPGHYIQFTLDEIIVEPKRYYEIPFNGQYRRATENVLVDELENYLQQAVKRQMLSDVEVGFFLSGGLDSSLLVAIAKKLYPDKRLQTFTIRTSGNDKSEGFADDLFYAQKVAAHLDVELEVVDSNIDILNDFDKMIWHLEEPQADPAPLNVLRICERAVAMGYKVLIGGTAGDDLFSGYRRHQALNFEKYFDRIPYGIRHLIHVGLMALPDINPTARRLKKIANGIHQSKEDRLLNLYSWLPYRTLAGLFQDGVKLILNERRPNEYLHQLLENVPKEKNWLNRMLFLEMRSFLVDHNLNYTDKMSMAVGVEVRVPYLDIDLVEYSTTLPPALKMRGKETKYILKKVAERYLPMDVIYRPKTGFGAPIRGWIKNELDEMIRIRLAPEKIRTRGIFNPEQVWKLIDENKKGRVDASYIIFSLLAIESWLEQFAEMGSKKAAVFQQSQPIGNPACGGPFIPVQVA